MPTITIIKKKVKNMTLRIRPDQTVILTAPIRLSDKRIQDFLEDKKTWIEKKLSEFAKTKSAIEVNAGQLLLHGQAYNLQIDLDLKKKVVIDHVEMIIRSGIDLQNQIIQHKRYKSYAKEFLKGRLDRLALHHGFAYRALKITNAKTRRGSCSAQKNIGLHRKLVKMPDFVMDYVICHELAHLEQMNHSPDFRAVVDRMIDNKKQAIAWMKRYGFSLY